MYEIDKTYNNLISTGEVSVCEPITEPWGQRTCYIADPEEKLTEVV
ncbi:glyoxalase [Clostridium butyricum]|nr:glyoxalase [Clostridium butyricum]